uniref:Zinc finger CW-type and PWWP domain containing 2 n=1 Tax=Molossus molossus TaxID=27622 RepID=A0A7J8DEL0_MOLMO|nr:zinc finger CW-type and PWWP domain containing 2 [Molossus molossus]
MDFSMENNMYVNKVWVQCENDSCLKWRLLSSEDAAKVDHNEPWYCYMNTDSRHNECSISEEDFPEESQFHQSGFKIVYSQLPLGSLVLVKLQNWPSWPGILCPDPFKGKYVTYDLDGNVEQYHIEFLGDPHSRSWINATFVEHYSITLKPGKCKNKKKWYISARQEACRLYGYSPEQRLEMCHLSKQVVSETEVLLKELEQMLQQTLEPTATSDESGEEHGEEINTGAKQMCVCLSPCGSAQCFQPCSSSFQSHSQLSKWRPEASANILFESHCEEDYLVIDGIKLKAGECIENITNKFKEIDALMSEF